VDHHALVSRESLDHGLVDAVHGLLVDLVKVIFSIRLRCPRIDQMKASWLESCQDVRREISVPDADLYADRMFWEVIEKG
jgi:hypothetical protein